MIHFNVWKSIVERLIDKKRGISIVWNCLGPLDWRIVFPFNMCARIAIEKIHMNTVFSLKQLHSWLLCDVFSFGHNVMHTTYRVTCTLCLVFGKVDYNISNSIEHHHCMSYSTYCVHLDFAPRNHTGWPLLPKFQILPF